MMKNQRPIQLKTFLAVYNIFQVVACVWVIRRVRFTILLSHYLHRYMDKHYIFEALVGTSG